MIKELKYISFYDELNSTITRNAIPSACDKVDSMVDLINRIGIDVHIISMSSVQEPSFKYYKGTDKVIRKGLRLKIFPSWGGNARLLRWSKIIWHVIALFIYLVFHTKKNEPILVYHSQGYWGIISLAKKIKNFKIILEVEEIFQDVRKSKYTIINKLEYKDINSADAFIFPTEILSKKINQKNKPYAIIHGRYTVAPVLTGKFADNKIHVVYAGTFDPDKGGAVAAIESAEFLPSNYHIHICGFGTDVDTNIIKRRIQEISAKSKAIVTFDGLKKGRDYNMFIQQCHIGLSTQNPSGDFNDTSFPSKILSYISNGLSVVSIDIPVVRSSAVAKYITFYNKQTPRLLADAIMNTPLKIDYLNCFKELSYSFIEDFKKLLK